jgi:hypothetical protein
MDLVLEEGDMLEAVLCGEQYGILSFSVFAGRPVARELIARAAAMNDALGVDARNIRNATDSRTVDTRSFGRAV